MTFSSFRGYRVHTAIAFLMLIPSLSLGQIFYSITDQRDGQKYRVVKIGNQWWMAQNLNVGEMIYNAFPQQDNGIIEKFCPYDIESFCASYGGIYQYDELMQYGHIEFNLGICPTGWHVPSDNEWKTMELFMGMGPEEVDSVNWRGTNEGGKLKSVASLSWFEPNACATDAVGFSALPAGGRSETGMYGGEGSFTDYWCADPYDDNYSWYRLISYDSCKMFRNAGEKIFGTSARCIKDSPFIFGRGTLTDPRDDKQYRTVLIGNHWWMAENLNAGRWIDIIGNQTDNDEIQKYCYNNLGQYCDTFGGLYQWDEMMNYNPENKKGICPDGWHIPSDNDWKELEFALGMPEAELDNTGLRGTNEGLFLMEGGGSGFDLLLGGYIDFIGNSVSVHAVASPWSSTQNNDQKAFQRIIYNNVTSIGRGAYFKSEANSVRCVNDNNEILTLAVQADDTVCAGQEFSIKASVSGGTASKSYSWTTVPPGFFSTDSIIFVATQTNTKYFVRIIDGNIYTQDSVMVNVKPAHELTIVGDSRVCSSDEKLQYSVNESPDYSYSWSATDGTSSSFDQNPVLINWGTIPGTRNLGVQVTDVKTGCSYRKNYAVEVMPAPQKPAILLKGQSLLICPDSGLIYQWSQNDVAIAGATKQFYYAKNNKSGNYIVETKLDNQCGNKSDPYSFELKSTKEWNDNEFQTVFIRPNPTSGNISMDIINDYTGPVKMIIINSIGRVVKQHTLYKYSAIFNPRFDLGELAEGPYFMIIEYGTNREVHRVTIQK
jgi:uncharacterized protein (TIGR02145 family)